MQTNHLETGIVLRPYQEAAIRAWDERRTSGLHRGVVNLPTGCGKTVTGLALAKQLGGRTLWLAHRDELIEQPLRAIRADLLHRLQMRDRAFGWPVEMVVKVAALGGRIVEVPVSHAPRLAGRSKVSGTLVGSVRAGYGFLKAALRAAAELRP